MGVFLPDAIEMIAAPTPRNLGQQFAVAVSVESPVVRAYQLFEQIQRVGL